MDWWFWFALLHEAGGSLLSPDGKKPAFRDKGAEALQFWVDLVNKDKTMKQPPGKDYSAWEVANTDFLNQRVGMIFTSTAFLNYMTENAKFKVGTAFLPAKVKSAVPDGRHVLRAAEGRAGAPEGSGLGLHQVDDGAGADDLALEGDRATCRCGSPPSTAPAMQSFYKENPNYKVALDQLKFAQRFPFSPALFAWSITGTTSSGRWS